MFHPPAVFNHTCIGKEGQNAKNSYEFDLWTAKEYTQRNFLSTDKNTMMHVVQEEYSMQTQVHGHYLETLKVPVLFDWDIWEQAILILLHTHTHTIPHHTKGDLM